MRVPRLIAVMGPTASGKSEAAEAVAAHLDAALLNADAFQVYRGLDVGTGKPLDRTRYRLLDQVAPDEDYGAGQWLLAALAELEILFAQGRDAVVVGGTGLYIRALFEGYDGLASPPPPELRARLSRQVEAGELASLVAELERLDPHAAESIDLANPRRVQRALERLLSPSEPLRFSLPAFHKIKIAIIPSTDWNDTAIDLRTRKMVYNGWIPEVQRLADRGYGPVDPGFRAHGYRALHRFLKGEVGLENVIQATTREVRQYAKRQRTWLRAEPNLIRMDSGRATVEAVLEFARD